MQYTNKLTEQFILYCFNMDLDLNYPTLTYYIRILVVK